MMNKTEKIGVAVMICCTIAGFLACIANSHLNPLTWLLCLLPVTVGITTLFWSDDKDDDE